MGEVSTDFPSSSKLLYLPDFLNLKGLKFGDFLWPIATGQIVITPQQQHLPEPRLLMATVSTITGKNIVAWDRIVTFTAWPSPSP
jgi:hypothetical protein